MAERFIVPSSPPESPPPSTPDKRTRHGTEESYMGENPSTTPTGPPSSIASFASPKDSADAHLRSSIMRGTTNSSLFGAGARSQASFGKPTLNRSGRFAGSFGRALAGKEKPPSGLSREVYPDTDSVEEIDEDIEGEDELPPMKGSLFRSFDDQSNGQAGRNDQTMADLNAMLDREVERKIDQEQESESDGSQEDSESGDVFLNMRHDDRPYGKPRIGDASEDLIMLETPAATKRVRQEAEDIFQRSMARLGGPFGVGEFKFATIATDFYSHYEPARITETPDLILRTEDLVCKLYDEGMGVEEDAEKLDNSLASVSSQLLDLWSEYVEGLPKPEGEDLATVGPGAQACDFERAAFVANLMLRLHHTKFRGSFGLEKSPPPPEVLLNWQDVNHNFFPDQTRLVLRHQPSPACHYLFWPTLRASLLRGDVNSASQLLRRAGWEFVNKGTSSEKAYTGPALEFIRQFANATSDLLDQCPATRSDWDIWNSSWTLFRIQAKASLDRMAQFAESITPSTLPPPSTGPLTMSTLARKATSPLPWDIYEHLQLVHSLLLGSSEAILGTAQDWCEATVGLFGWWDASKPSLETSRPQRSLRFEASMAALRVASPADYYARLASAFHLVLDANLSPNARNPVEVALACVFEGNIDGALRCLRVWSLPVATSVTEIASLGQWLPQAPSTKSVPLEALDMEDLAILGITPPSVDEIEGLKDTTLVLYARELAGVDSLSPDRAGWEMAIEVLGRMDSREKSDETVGQLMRDLLERLDATSGATVDKMWRILNDLGMVTYAEETAKHFAEILLIETHLYGEVLWYYALSHQPDRVLAVVRLLMSYSLVQSIVVPAEEDLDDSLKSLLRNRKETLELRAEQDLEAAQLLGRMLSGYATLRLFYEVRDGVKAETPATKVLALKKQAASALAAVILSADDPIRGGLYDASRDAVACQDFLLALLGEATVFVHQSPTVITTDQVHILLKAIEDLQTVGSRTYDECDDRFALVLSSKRGMRDAMPRALSKQLDALLTTSSYEPDQGARLTAHLHTNLARRSVQRGWDWRKSWQTQTTGRDVLRTLRVGLARDLAALFLEEADGVVTLG